MSALVANLIAADYLILLTDQKGLYDADPRINPNAELIPVVEKIDESNFCLAGGTSMTSGLGTGEMTTKIQAARLATQSGTKTIIAHAMIPNVLHEIIHGHSVGTYFKPCITVREKKALAPFQKASRDITCGCRCRGTAQQKGSKPLACWHHQSKPSLRKRSYCAITFLLLRRARSHGNYKLFERGNSKAFRRQVRPNLKSS